MLAQIVNFHPHVVCGWQWTAQIPFWNKVSVAKQGLIGEFQRLPAKDKDYMESIYSPAIACIGYRALFRSSDKWILHPRLSPPLWLDRLESHIDWLKATDIAVIHISRDDHLAWLRSYVFSRITKLYVDSPYPEGLMVNIDKNEAVARVRSKQWIDYRLAHLANTNPYIRIKYESLNKDKQRTGERVIAFLGYELDCYQINERTIHRKQARGATDESIENYDELRILFERTGILDASM